MIRIEGLGDLLRELHEAYSDDDDPRRFRPRHFTTLPPVRVRRDPFFEKAEMDRLYRGRMATTPDVVARDADIVLEARARMESGQSVEAFELFDEMNQRDNIELPNKPHYNRKYSS